MKILRKLLFLKNIYFKQTALQIVIFYVPIAFLLFLSSDRGQNNRNSPVLLFTLIFLALYGFTRTVVRSLFVNRLLKTYKEKLDISPSEVRRATVNLELNHVDKLRLIEKQDNSQVYLATFDFYRHLKHGQYLAKQAYYLVAEVQLKRHLPHILFDSKSAKRNQFKSIYLKVQKVSLQAPFDDSFDTYMPQSYNIDVLSFISPEVMEALLTATDYDIEIINNKLLLFAPLLDEREKQMLIKKAQYIAEHINDNIDNYRDDRLKGLDRKNNVTNFARSLLKSPYKYILISILSGLLIILNIILAFVTPNESSFGILVNQFSVINYVIFFSNLTLAYKIVRTNKQAIAQFKANYADKPIR